MGILLDEALDLVYRNLFGFTPREQQKTLFKSMFETLEKEEIPRFLVKLPCGYGKTEAAVAPFLAQFMVGDYPLAYRLIYVLPTRALCNQIFERFLGWNKKLYELTNQSLLVNVHHGMFLVDPYFISNILITTLDQFIYCYSRIISVNGKSTLKHSEMAAGSIGLSYIVFDEAHMYSSYTHALMKRMIEILIEGNIPFVVMTATMPQTLIDDIFGNLNVEITKINYEKTFIPYRGYVDINFEEENLLNVVNSYIREQNNTLIVCNTVERAQKVYSKIKKKSKLLIHSRFKTCDRSTLEKQICKKLGKNHQDNYVVVSTQVCEVGLNISADVLLSELAPADSLVQRIGRCARWGNNGIVHIFNVTEVSPYEENAMSMTREYVEREKIDITNWKSTMDFVNILRYHVNSRNAREALARINQALPIASKISRSIKVREDENVFIYVPESETNVTTNFIMLKDLLNNIVPAPLNLTKRRLKEWLHVDRNTKIYTAQPVGNREGNIWYWSPTTPATLEPNRIYLGKSKFYNKTYGYFRWKITFDLYSAQNERYSEHVNALMEEWDKFKDKVIYSFKRIFKFEEKVSCERSIKAVLIHHDVGKLTEKWQEYIQQEQKKEINHSILGAVYVYCLLKHNNLINQAFLASVYESILIHHTGRSISGFISQEDPVLLLHRSKIVDKKGTIKWHKHADELVKNINDKYDFKHFSLSNITLDTVKKTRRESYGWIKLHEHKARICVCSIYHFLKVCDLRASSKRRNDDFMQKQSLITSLAIKIL